MKKVKAPEQLSDDDLVTEIQDLIDEIGADGETRETMNEAEEALDEDGELSEERRKVLHALLLKLRDRQDKGDVQEEFIDDIEDDDVELEEPDDDE